MSVKSYLLAIGKLKDTHILEIENHYLKIIREKLEVLEIKANAENADSEALEAYKKIQNLSKKPKIILLSERGKKYSSLEFAEFIKKEVVEENKDVFFCIGGATGHGELMKKNAFCEISLSPMTFPHKLTRPIFIEQFYRAHTILSGHPYHND